MQITFHPYEFGFVETIRNGGADAYGSPAERAISGGVGTPCRNCLHNVPEGAEMLVLAARPFPVVQPFAETGPIFFCADACTPWTAGTLPPILKTSPDYLMKAYGADNRIKYGTGRIVPSADLQSYAQTLLQDADVSYVDVRSSRNNCFLTRITKQ